MSLSEIYISDVEQSDLKLAGEGGLEGQLVHPYQALRSYPGSNNFDIRTVSFSSPAFAKVNTIQIPAMNFIPHEMYIQMQLGAEGTVTGAAWEPTPTWISGGGVNLLYKDSSVYNMSEAECLLYALEDEDPRNQLKKQDSYGFNQAADAADTAQMLYIPLTPLCEQVLSKVGPLGSYSANEWSISIDLKAENLCMSNSTTAETPDAALNSMKLIMVGSKAPAGEVAMARAALENGGIVWNFLRSNHQRSTLADNAATATTYTENYNSLVGAVSQMRLLIRDKAKLDATTVSTKDNIAYQVYNGVADNISVGKLAQPNEVFGQAINQKFVRNFFSADSLKGSPRFLSTAATIGEVDTGVFNINFCESQSDKEFGTSSGSYPVKNDFQIQLLCTSDTVQDNYLDSVIYTHVKGLISKGGANINLSS